MSASVIWGTLLLAGQWLLLGLVYLALLAVVLHVRAELRAHLSTPPSPEAAGRLRVLAPGAAPRVRTGAEYLLPPEAVLGAGAGSTIRLADPYVSGAHARLSWDGRAWWVEDLGSANGTLVNGRRCLPHQKCPLPYGAHLAVGGVVLELAA